MFQCVRHASTTGAGRAFPPGARIFSLIQPTGRIHLGNYLGAIRNWRDIADNAPDASDIIFGIADLHSITIPHDPKLLKQYRYEAIASLLACGLDPKKCILYHQLAVPEHTELNWILVCNTSMGALNRMTQWKLKANVESSSTIFEDDVLGKTNAGLLNYPVLQAADILIYKATHVPVGDDQSQHLELCRNIAAKFNHTYKTKFFPLPRTVLTPAKKILALRNPHKKMSKSDKDQGLSLYLTEDADSISRKIRRAVTDSVQGPVTFDPVERPGVSNLINIVLGITGRLVEETVDDLSWVKDHKQLKDHVTELLVSEFKDKRVAYEQIMADRAYLDTLCQDGARRAREIASKNMAQVRALVGLD